MTVNERMDEMDEDGIEYDQSLRLECLKMSLCVHGQGSMDQSVITTARSMYEFVINDDDHAVTQ